MRNKMMIKWIDEKYNEDVHLKILLLQKQNKKW